MLSYNIYTKRDACVRACVRACVCVCVCARARARARVNPPNQLSCTTFYFTQRINKNSFWLSTLWDMSWQNLHILK